MDPNNQNESSASSVEILFIPEILRDQYYTIMEKNGSQIKARCVQCGKNGKMTSVIKGQSTSTGNFIRHYKVNIEHEFNKRVMYKFIMCLYFLI